MSARLVKSGIFINRGDLQRSQASFANKKAKQMMGAANPLTGSDIRKPASTHCTACGRWHRPGNLCPAAKKSMPTNVGQRVMPTTLREQDLLNYKIEQPPPPTPQEQQQQLVEGSGHLQNQLNNYLDVLRYWQARYGA